MPKRDIDLGYLALPDAQGEAQDDSSVPGVVLIHDVWGLTDPTRDLTRRLAGEGFAVLALDLYRRESEVRISDPASWMQEMSDPQALEDIAAGVGHLRQGGASGPRRVGVGWEREFRPCDLTTFLSSYSLRIASSPRFHCRA